MMNLTKSKIHPFLGILLCIFIMIYSMVFSYHSYTIYFLISVYFIFIIFGLYKEALRVIPFAIISILIFSGLTYLINKNLNSANAMTNRLLGLTIAVIPGMAIRPIDLTRCLNQIRVPRSITLGMLITLSFVPLLHDEIRQIKDAMRTRGATKILSPRIFYRAFLIPLTMRIVNISDTLALSVETRGFEMKGKKLYNL